MMKSFRLRAGRVVVWTSLGTLSTIAAPSLAMGDFFFRPFGFTFNQPIPEPEPAPDVSPRRIGAILARRGFRLAGPLGFRGQQVVADGVDARGRRKRFLVDPYEGRVLNSWGDDAGFERGAPPPPAVAVPTEPHGAPNAADPGEPTVIPGIGAETPPRRARR